MKRLWNELEISYRVLNERGPHHKSHRLLWQQLAPTQNESQGNTGRADQCRALTVGTWTSPPTAGLEWDGVQRHFSALRDPVLASHTTRRTSASICFSLRTAGSIRRQASILLWWLRTNNLTFANASNAYQQEYICVIHVI